jgi:outer membrane protein W
MNKRAAVLAVGFVIGTLICGAAQAQTAPPANRLGVDVGIRLGYAIPAGNISGTAGDGMNDNFWGAVPLILESAYHVTEGVSVGVLFQYAVLQLKDNSVTGCDSNGLTCSGAVTRVGVQAMYHLFPRPGFVPWVGVGTGYEWLNVDLSQNGGSVSSTARGFEFLTLHAGVDFRETATLSIGPFASFSLGRYQTETFDAGGTSTPMEITDQALHGWLQIGARGTLGI